MPSIGKASLLFGLFVLATIALPCIRHRRMPQEAAFVYLYFVSLGIPSGVKILWYGFDLTDAQLGILADDRAVLMMGGLATFVYALKETVQAWKKAAGYTP